jgi:hypothetical protein
LDLFSSSQNLPERQELKGTGISKRFNETVQEKGGNKEGQAMANDAVTRGVMGCSTKDLYRATSGRPGKVSSLPTAAQEGLAVGKIAANHALNAEKEIDGNQQQVNQQIADISHDAAKKAGGIFPWNW